MPQAMPVRAHPAHPDSIRIVALAAAISLNVALLLMAMRPLAPMLQRLTEAPTPMTLVFRDPSPAAAPVPPPPMPIQALPQHTVKLHPAPVPAPVSNIVTPVAIPAPVAMPPVTTGHASMPAAATTQALSAPVNLATLQAPPPRYPIDARRAGMEGTVVLRVLVDEQGIPRKVLIDRGSGHRPLDRAARRQVLEHWRFRPAREHGQAVQAWALVPVTFSLRQL